MSFEETLNALLFQAGYNASLVILGTMLLGITAGGCGTILIMRRQALVSDAIAHATLPGICLSFLIMLWAGWEGRSLLALSLGAAASAYVGLIALRWLSRNTRIGEEAAIGAILSVFFGSGVVLLTVIQSLGQGNAAGLESFLLGAASGMLRDEAILILFTGSGALFLMGFFFRPILLASFDPNHANAIGLSTHMVDRLATALALMISVIGLKIAGLVLIVALMIIPGATARLWTNRADHMIFVACAIGGIAAYIGAAISSSGANLPTGPVIVLVAAFIFLLSLMIAPAHGALPALFHRFQLSNRIHLRQGLLALGRGEAILEKKTLKLLITHKLIRGDGIPTESGKTAIREALLDERRARHIFQLDPTRKLDLSLALSVQMTPDEMNLLDEHLKQTDFREAHD